MTKIEWATETWNPAIGCSKISEGCKNCYAERMAGRLAHMGMEGYTEIVQSPGDPLGEARGPLKWNGKTALVKSAIEKPLHWKKPRRIFVCSMGDLFHESVPFEWIYDVFNVAHAARTAHHNFIFLTKRPGRMIEALRWWCERRYRTRTLPEVMESLCAHWLLGVTAENQQTADERIPVLLQVPAAVRFVSVEPMLGSLDLALTANPPRMPSCENYRRLDWVICGGESGPGARPVHPDWVRSLRDQCKMAGIPYFFKQWGEHLSEDYCMQNDINVNGGPDIYVHQHNENYYKVGKKAAGRLLDGETWDQIPEVQS